MKLPKITRSLPFWKQLHYSISKILSAIITLLIIVNIIVITFTQKVIAQTDNALKSIVQQGHSLTVHSVSFHPDGKTFLSFGNDNIARLWSRDGNLIKTIPFKYESSMEYTPDGKYLVGKNGFFDLEGKPILPFSLSNGNRIALFKMSNDGQVIAVAMDNLSTDKYQIQLFDTKGKKLKNLTGIERSITSLNFSPDGQLLAIVSGTEKPISLWSGTTRTEPTNVEVILMSIDGQILQKLPVETDIASLKFSPDGKRIIAIQENGKVFIWRTNGVLVKSFSADSYSKEISCSPNNNNFLIGGYSGINIYDSTGLKIKWLQGNMVCSKYSTDGKYIIAGNYSAINIFDANGNLINSIVESKFDIDEAKFLNKGGLFYSGKSLWSLEGTRISMPEKYYIYYFSNNGEYMAGISSRWGTPIRSDDISLLKLDGTLVATFQNSSFVKFTDKEIIVKKDNSTNFNYRYDYKGVFIDSVQKNSITFFTSDLSYSATYDETGVHLFDSTGKLVKFFDIPAWQEHPHYMYDKAAYIETYKKNGLLFSPSGKYIIIHQPKKIQIWDVASLELLGEISTIYYVNGTEFFDQITAAATHFVDNEEKVFVIINSQVVIADIKGKIVSQTKIACKNCGIRTETVLSNDGKFVALGMENNQIYSFDTETGKTVGVSPIQPNTIMFLDYSPDSRLLLSKDFNGNNKLWKSGSMEEVAQFIPVDKKDFAIITPDGFYTASKNAGKQVHFVKGIKTFTFENFDLLYNRPDIVLERIGFAKPEIITALKNAYQKRQMKMGFSEGQISLDAHLPEIELTDAEIPLITNQKFLAVNIKVTDSKYLLDRIYVSVNGVPVDGLKGISIKDQKTSELKKQIKVELTSGKNTIQYSVMNEKGAESTKEKIDITYSGEVIRPNLYVIVVGVSKYHDSEFNLRYAAKDASDIADLFSTQNTKFNKVNVLKILDADATKDKIMQAKAFLLKGKVEDQVVLFVAGHGLLDEKLNFYFATTNVDFNNPGQLGLPYENLDDLVDGIPQRHKLVLIDACNSGEVDKENSELANVDSKVYGGKVAARGFKSVKTKSGLGLSNSFELMQNLFSDLTKGSGAMVISSASGSEFAFESDAWKNGVFTYSFLEGIKSKNADLNKDQNINVWELRDYVIQKVGILTDGKQHPTSRKENAEFDFNVW